MKFMEADNATIGHGIALKEGGEGWGKAGAVLGAAGTALGIADLIWTSTKRGKHDGRGYEGGYEGYGYGGYGRYPVCDGGLETKEAALLRQRISTLEAEKYTDHRLFGVEKQLCAQQNEITRLQCELNCFREAERRDIHDVYAYANCTFVPQEKGYVDGSKINYHRVKPFVGVELDHLGVPVETPGFHAVPNREGRRGDDRNDYYEG